MDYQSIIDKYYPEDNKLKHILCQHSREVADKALRIVDAHPELGADRQFVEEAAMIHDIGIFRCDADGIAAAASAASLAAGHIGVSQRGTNVAHAAPILHSAAVHPCTPDCGFALPPTWPPLPPAKLHLAASEIAPPDVSGLLQGVKQNPNPPNFPTTFFTTLTENRNKILAERKISLLCIPFVEFVYILLVVSLSTRK